MRRSLVTKLNNGGLNTLLFSPHKLSQLTLFRVLMLGNSEKKPEISTIRTQTPTAVDRASLAFGNTTFSYKKPESLGNKTAILATAQMINSAYL